MRISTREVAKLLGIELATLRLLMREGKINCCLSCLTPRLTQLVGRGRKTTLKRARKVLQSIRGCIA